MFSVSAVVILPKNPKITTFSFFDGRTQTVYDLYSFDNIYRFDCFYLAELTVARKKNQLTDNI